MVGDLIRLRRRVVVNSAAATATPWLVAAGVLGVLAAGATAVTPLVTGATAPGAATDTLAFVLALWVGGQVAQAALRGGDPLLPPELLALLPVPARTLAAATLLAGVTEPGTVITAVALAALVVHAVPLGPGALGVALLGWALTLLATVALAALAGAALAPAARRGRDLATLVAAVGLGAVALAGTLLPLLAAALRERSSPVLTAAVRALPSGWGPVAVDASARGDTTTVVLALVGLGLLGAGAAALLPRALARRVAGRAVPARRPRRRRHRLRLTSPTGAVVAKELRLWARDPLRVTCLLLALVVAVGTAALPAVLPTGTGTRVLLPFAGLLWTVIAAACAANLYGNDGVAVWSTLLTPGSARPDIHGRQLAWLAVTAPAAVLTATVGLLAAHQGWAWPWAVALTPALLGGGAAVVAHGCTHAVLPLDATGGPTPAWSVKVHLCLYATLATAVPTAVPLVLGSVLHAPALSWSAVPIALLTGPVLARVSAGAAVRRLPQLGPTLLSSLEHP